LFCKHETVDIPASNIKRAIANILLEEGYIKGIEEIDDGKQGVLRLKLKYTANKQNVISGLKRISKPGLRVYAGRVKYPKFWVALELLYFHFKGNYDG